MEIADIPTETTPWAARLATLRTRSAVFVVPYVATIAGAAAWAEEQARAVAYTDYFGLPYVGVDPREAFVPFAIVTLFLLVSLWILLSFLRTLVAAMTPQLLPVFAVLVLALPPYSRAGLRADAIVIAIGLVGLGATRGVRHLGPVVRAVDAWLARHDGTRGALRRFEQMTEALSLRPVAPLLWSIILGAAVVLGAGAVGHWFGANAAATQDEFKVLERRPARQTIVVVFIDGDRSVERTLDVSPSTGGVPRNVWLPDVTIRPIPPTGLRYELVELGRTTKAEPSRP